MVLKAATVDGGLDEGTTRAKWEGGGEEEEEEEDDDDDEIEDDDPVRATRSSQTTPDLIRRSSNSNPLLFANLTHVPSSNPGRTGTTTTCETARRGVQHPALPDIPGPRAVLFINRSVCWADYSARSGCRV